jgi:hypothetical protein
MSDSNHELQLADQFVRDTGCNVFLTGKAGTGKTTFLHNLKKDCDKRMVVTAPTGVAAINAGGVTLHSFFQLPFGPFVPGSEDQRQYRFNREKINLIKSLDLLVIDEISMVRADLLDGVDSVLRRYRRSNLPFGGVQLLLIGDLHQLAPVVKPEDWRILGPHYSSPYFFASSSLEKTELITIELQHIYRQADAHFIQLLNQVRNSNLDKKSLDHLNSRYQAESKHREAELSGYITLCTHNNRADAINTARLAGLSANSRTFSAEVEGEFPEHAYPTPHSLELKIGAQVMFVRNDSSYEKRYFNGKIGSVTRISADRIWIRCPDDHDEIIVEPATWENIEYSLDQETMEVKENKVGAFVQYPLKLAWAITIHKSQGLTFDHAIIDAQAAFAPGQVYVALSRCRTLEGMILSSPLSQTGIRTDRSVLAFTREAASKLPGDQQLRAAKIRYQKALLLDCFDYKRLQYLLGRLSSSVRRYGDLLRLVGIADLNALQQATTNEICTIGQNFRRQLKGLFQEDLLPSEDPMITERLQKASVYFTEKMNQYLMQVVPGLYVETDNKEMSKQLKRQIGQLQEETAIKFAAISSCENGFNNNNYLRAISSAEILTQPLQSGRPKKVAPLYAEADIEHPELFESLKNWRTERTRRENIAAFLVMHQKTLIQIAVHLPDSRAALKRIKGIGRKLIERYGEELLEIVVAYRKKHHISEVQLPIPEHGTVAEQTQQKKRAAVGGEDTKQLSFALFKEGLKVAEIAKQRDLKTSTIEKHLAHFVAQGEIELKEFVSHQRQQSIEEQLDTAKGQKLSEIKAALGPGYSYSEISFVLAHRQFLTK